MIEERKLSAWEGQQAAQLEGDRARMLKFHYDIYSRFPNIAMEEDRKLVLMV